MLRDEYHYVLASLGALEIQLGEYAQSRVNISSFALHAYAPPTAASPQSQRTGLSGTGGPDAVLGTGNTVDRFGERTRRLLASLGDLLGDEHTDSNRVPVRTPAE